MGLMSSTDKAASMSQQQQQQCATETPTGSESQDPHVLRDIPIGGDDIDDTKAAPVCKAEPEKPPHNYEAILKDADEDFRIDKSSVESLYNQLYDGVFLNKKRQKYWVDKESRSNCFMLYARELTIVWGDDDQYWTWVTHPETRDVSVEVAELIMVCWLEIHAKFDTTKLTPGTLYQVAFVIKMQNPTGWSTRVNLTLTCPDGTKQEREENLVTIKKDDWVEIPVGEFQVSPENTKPLLEISMLEIKSGKWKSGLAIKGVIIQPKNNLTPE